MRPKRFRLDGLINRKRDDFFLLQNHAKNDQFLIDVLISVSGQFDIELVKNFEVRDSKVLDSASIFIL